MRRVLVLCLAVAGCGGSAAAPAARPKPPPPCSPRVAAVAGAPRLVARDPDIVTCEYGGAVKVIVDSAPQALVRWQRAEVERTQTTSEWANIPDQQARMVSGVGMGAFWVRGPRELVASDGRRLVTVRVLHAGKSARATAIRVARAAL
ncbi:hypothetical protein [Solirubrobacter soli]|uniref:hypothetical protein n=1 Tax=Solirubrobacter soli TaxID=363832 RepID=UPI00040E2588|nr:hypothetical protein [Solirubrobacter soli]